MAGYNVSNYGVSAQGQHNGAQKRAPLDANGFATTGFTYPQMAVNRGGFVQNGTLNPHATGATTPLAQAGGTVLGHYNPNGAVTGAPLELHVRPDGTMYVVDKGAGALQPGVNGPGNSGATSNPCNMSPADMMAMIQKMQAAQANGTTGAEGSNPQTGKAQPVSPRTSEELLAIAKELSGMTPEEQREALSVLSPEDAAVVATLIAGAKGGATQNAGRAALTPEQRAKLEATEAERLAQDAQPTVQDVMKYEAKKLDEASKKNTEALETEKKSMGVIGKTFNGIKNNVGADYDNTSWWNLPKKLWGYAFDYGSGSEAAEKAQKESAEKIRSLKALAQQDTPESQERYAELYKEVTGKEFDPQAVVERAEVAAMAKAEKLANAKLGKIEKNTLAAEPEVEDMPTLAAAERTKRFAESQQNGVDVIADVGTGLVVAGGLALTPFTGGASLAASAAIIGGAAVAGAAVKPTLKFIDNVSAEESKPYDSFAYDATTGAVGGLLTVVAPVVGNRLGSFVVGAGTRTAATTTTRTGVLAGVRNGIANRTAGTVGRWQAAGQAAQAYRAGGQRTVAQALASEALTGSTWGAGMNTAREAGLNNWENIPGAAVEGAILGAPFGLVTGLTGIGRKVGKRASAAEGEATPPTASSVTEPAAVSPTVRPAEPLPTVADELTRIRPRKPGQVVDWNEVNQWSDEMAMANHLDDIVETLAPVDELTRIRPRKPGQVVDWNEVNQWSDEMAMANNIDDIIESLDAVKVRNNPFSEVKDQGLTYAERNRGQYLEANRRIQKEVADEAQLAAAIDEALALGAAQQKPRLIKAQAQAEQVAPNTANLLEIHQGSKAVRTFLNKPVLEEVQPAYRGANILDFPGQNSAGLGQLRDSLQALEAELKNRVQQSLAQYFAGSPTAYNNVALRTPFRNNPYVLTQDQAAYLLRQLIQNNG